MSINPVTDMTVTYNVALLTVDNLPNGMSLISDILNTIANESINIDMISQTPSYRGSISLSFSIPSKDLIRAITALNSFRKTVPELHVEVDSDNTKLSVYGEHMKDMSGVAAKLFTLLAANNIDVKFVTTSEMDISYLLYEKDIDKAINAIKEEYGLE